MRAVNLLPQDARGRTGLGSFKPRPAHAVALVLVLLAGMALLYGQARNTAQQAESEAIVVRTETANVERASAKDVATAAEVPAFEKYVGGVAKVVTSRYDWGPLFHQLAVTVPTGVMFQQLTMTLGTGSTTAGAASALSTPASMAQPQGAAMVLKGCASSQNDVAALMRRLRAVDDVSEVALVSSVRPLPNTTTTATGGCPKNPTVFDVSVAVGAPKPWAGEPITKVVTAAEVKAAAKHAADHAKSKKGGAR
jgi:Tfp pilus assembly protein PilN